MTTPYRDLMKDGIRRDSNQKAIIVTNADNSETELGIEYLRNALLKCKAKLGKLGDRVGKAEQSLRDITKDRDRWKALALTSQAALQSRGVDKANPATLALTVQCPICRSVVGRPCKVRNHLGKFSGIRPHQQRLDSAEKKFRRVSDERPESQCGDASK